MLHNHKVSRFPKSTGQNTNEVLKNSLKVALIFESLSHCREASVFKIHLPLGKVRLVFADGFPVHGNLQLAAVCSEMYRKLVTK